MRHRNRHVGHSLLSGALWLLPLVTAAVVEGCASSFPPIVVHESAKGSVYLAPLRQGGAPAAHPISLGSATLARVMAGLRVQQEARMLQTLLAGSPKKEAVFSENEAQFLAPLLHTALSRASSNQAVRFRAFRASDTGTLTTGGTLYVKDQSLYLTLTEYRVGSDGRHTLNKYGQRLRDATGLKRKTVLFVPEGVERTDADPQRGVEGPPHLKTFVIDYALLAKLATVTPEPASPSRAPIEATRFSAKDTPNGTDRETGSADATLEGNTGPGTTESLKDLIIKKDLEIEALKEDVRSLQRQLEESRQPLPNATR